MKTINATLHANMGSGNGIPIVRLHDVNESATLLVTEDGAFLTTHQGVHYLAAESGEIGATTGIEILSYELARLTATVTVRNTGTPMDINDPFYIERGVEIAGTEYTDNTSLFYVQTYEIDAHGNTITYRGHIFPKIPATIPNVSQDAETAITAGLLDATLTACFPAGGDFWYSWQLEALSQSYHYTNIQTLISTIRKKYLAVILPRAGGIVFGHPGTFAGDDFADYDPNAFIKSAPLTTQKLFITAQDEAQQPRHIGSNINPTHNIGFLHTDVDDADVIANYYLYNGGDTFTQRPDFRLEHGDSLTPPAGSANYGIACLEVKEKFLRGQGRPVWQQEVSPIRLQSGAASVGIEFIDTSADDADQGGNPQSEVGVASYMPGDDAGFLDRFLPPSINLDHFNKPNPALWTWAQDSYFSLPSFSFDIYPSIILVHNTAGLHYFYYQTYDPTYSKFYVLVHNINAALRIDDGTNNNFIQIHLVDLDESEVIPQVIAFEIIGTKWSSWQVNAYATSIWNGPLPPRYQSLEGYPVTPATWTPARVGFSNSGDDSRILAYDAFAYMTNPSENWPS